MAVSLDSRCGNRVEVSACLARRCPEALESAIAGEMRPIPWGGEHDLGHSERGSDDPLAMNAYPDVCNRLSDQKDHACDWESCANLDNISLKFVARWLNNGYV